MRATGWAVTWTEHGEEQRKELRHYPGAKDLEMDLLSRGITDVSVTVITGPDLPRPVGMPAPKKTRRPYERDSEEEADAV